MSRSSPTRSHTMLPAATILPKPRTAYAHDSAVRYLLRRCSVWPGSDIRVSSSRSTPRFAGEPELGSSLDDDIAAGIPARHGRATVDELFRRPDRSVPRARTFHHLRVVLTAASSDGRGPGNTTRHSAASPASTNSSLVDRAHRGDMAAASPISTWTSALGPLGTGPSRRTWALWNSEFGSRYHSARVSDRGARPMGWPRPRSAQPSCLLAAPTAVDARSAPRSSWVLAGRAASPSPR